MNSNRKYEDQEMIKKARKQLVSQRNDFLQKTSYSLDKSRNTLLKYLISKVKPTDTQETILELKISEIARTLGYRTKSYSKIKQLLSDLNAYSWWMPSETDPNEEQLVQFFSSDNIFARQDEGIVRIKWSKRFYPIVIGLAKQQKEEGVYFTSYELQNILLMDHFYSQRLYEILKSYQYNNEEWTFEVGTGSPRDIQSLLVAEDPKTKKRKIPASWKKWTWFETYVLAVAKEDIDKYTDIKIDYTPSRYDLNGVQHRKVCSITIAMVNKSESEIEERDRIIDVAFREIDVSDTTKPDKAAELIANQKEILQKEKEKKARESEIKKNKAFENRVKESPYPIFTNNLGMYFTDKQLEALHGYCDEKINISIPSPARDMWATDYVLYYYKFVDATPEDTKTTIYRRVLDYVRKDYEYIAYNLNALYACAEPTKKKYSETPENLLTEEEEATIEYMGSFFSEEYKKDEK